jgi:hypothetical protein
VHRYATTGTGGLFIIHRLDVSGVLFLTLFFHSFFSLCKPFFNATAYAVRVTSDHHLRSRPNRFGFVIARKKTLGRKSTVTRRNRMDLKILLRPDGTMFDNVIRAAHPSFLSSLRTR